MPVPFNLGARIVCEPKVLQVLEALQVAHFSQVLYVVLPDVKFLQPQAVFKVRQCFDLIDTVERVM